MNIGKPLLLLLLFVGACTTDSHSPNTEDVGQWQQTAEKLTTLLKEEKFRETENMTKIKLSELLGNVNNAEENDTLIKYAREILTISYYNYLKSKQIRSGMEYMDSLSQIPFIQENCKHELLSARASLHQMHGDNEQAIGLANEYLQLPDYEDADRFIPQAEMISEFILFRKRHPPSHPDIGKSHESLPTRRRVPEYASHHVTTRYLLPPYRGI